MALNPHACLGRQRDLLLFTAPWFSVTSLCIDNTWPHDCGAHHTLLEDPYGSLLVQRLVDRLAKTCRTRKKGELRVKRGLPMELLSLLRVSPTWTSATWRVYILQNLSTMECPPPSSSHLLQVSCYLQNF